LVTGIIMGVSIILSVAKTWVKSEAQELVLSDEAEGGHSVGFYLKHQLNNRYFPIKKIANYTFDGVWHE